ncbi:MAG: hypothetical protein ABEH43_02005, partial [Flavobacteriales bacterium]
MYKKVSIIVLIVVLIASLFMARSAINITFDHDYEKFFPPEDTATEFFMEHRKMFETDNDFVLIGIENDEGVFEKSFLERVEKYTQELKDFSYVRTIISPVNLKEPIKDPLMGKVFQRPVLRYKN